MNNQKKDNSNNVAWTILLILMVIVFVVIILGGIFSSVSEHIIEIASTSNTTNKNTSYTKTQSNVTSQETEKSKEEHNKYIEEQKKIGDNNLKEIRKAYKQNELSANDKYSGKTYNLYAKLDSIREDGLMNKMLSKISVTLTYKDENRIIYIFCDFNKNQRNILSKYKQGDYILFSGICSSWGNWYNCKVIE